MSRISKRLLIPILMLSLMQIVKSQFNQSVCGYIENNNLFYFINQAKNDYDINQAYEDKTLAVKYNGVLNLCHQLQYWCEKQNDLVIGSLVAIDNQGYCYQFQQTQIDLINPTNASSGIKVTYKAITPDKTSNKPLALLDTIVKEYPCNQNIKIGCPQVSRTTIWTYFQKNSLSYTIAIQVVGVLFMIFGVYMYRVTLVIIGWATAFLILLSIQQTVVFIPGVPQQVLGNVMLLTIICSFFMGYVLAYFPKAGLFCMGMWIGLIISLTLNNVALYLIYSTPQNLPLYIVLPVLCVGFGILTVCVKRKFIVFATSLIGAYICLRALSWHLGAFPNELLYPQQYKLGLKGIVTWQFYLYVIALLILTASSSALQFWLFKKKVQKNNQSGDIDEHFDQMQHKLQNQRQNLMQFDNIFKKLKGQHRNPRVLKKEDSDDQYQIKKENKRNSYKKSEMSFQDQDEDKQQPSQEQQPKQKYKRKQLQQNLLSKGTKKRK